MTMAQNRLSDAVEDLAADRMELMCRIEVLVGQNGKSFAMFKSIL